MKPILLNTPMVKAVLEGRKTQTRYEHFGGRRMIAVLISIQPKWCAKIASGEKTVEVRKTRPKLETPFKCYIYKTREKRGKLNDLINDLYGGGKVIGEFVCDKVDEYKYFTQLPSFNSMGLPSGYKGSYLIFEDEYKAMCLTYDELKEYGNGKNLYAWHISDLKIYDTPEELGEFKERCTDKPCNNCKYLSKDLDGEIKCAKIAGAPQSWCYVEEA